MFAELKRFHERFGHCNVKAWKENRKLAGWTANQRRLRKSLSADRKTRLDGIGFIWDLFGTAWETMFAELTRYRQRFGHCNVLYDWDENPKLGRWVSVQRGLQIKCRLSSERKARLDALEFDWGPQAKKHRAGSRRDAL
jgi:hypothetical protein